MKIQALYINISIFIGLLMSLNIEIIGALNMASCVELPKEYASPLVNMCGPIINYPFFLPANKSITDIITKINLGLSDTSIHSLPVSCQESIVKIVCAKAFLKCIPDVKLSNISTYDHTTYSSEVGVSFPIPFQRPSVSLCDDLLLKCSYFSELLLPTMNCSTQAYDYSFGALNASQLPLEFDPIASSSNSNIIAATILSLGADSELYLRQSDGACAGIVTDIYIPPASLVSSALPPLLPPYAIQTQIESILAANFAILPVFLSPSCQLAIREYFCSSYFLKPTLVYYLGIPAHFPSYPSYSVCTKYEQQCGAFIGLAAASGETSVVPNCNATVANSPIRLYPTTTQVVYANSDGSVVIETPPNTLSNTTVQLSDFSSDCPAGFVIPDHPDDSRVLYVPGTGCAVPCRYNIYTESENHSFDVYNSAFTVISVILVSFLLITFIVLDRTKISQYFYIFILALIYFVQMFVECFEISPTNGGHSSSLCYDNAIRYDYTFGHTFCSTQGFFRNYLNTAGLLGVLAIVNDLMYRYVLRFKRDVMAPFNLAVMFSLPWFPSIWTIGRQHSGYNGFSPYCEATRTQPHTIFLMINIPYLVYVFAIWLPVIVVGVKLAITPADQLINFPSENTEAEQVLAANPNETNQMYSKKKNQAQECLMFIYAQYLFALIVAIFSSIYTAFVTKFTLMLLPLEDRYLKWTECVFKNYASGNDEDWQNACGLRESLKLSVSYTRWAYVWECTCVIVFAFIFIPTLFRSYKSINSKVSVNVKQIKVVEAQL